MHTQSLDQKINNLANLIKKKYLQALIYDDSEKLVQAFEEVDFPKDLVQDKFEYFNKQIFIKIPPSFIISERKGYIGYSEANTFVSLEKAYIFYKNGIINKQISQISQNLKLQTPIDVLISDFNIKSLNCVCDSTKPMALVEALAVINNQISIINATRFDKNDLKDKKIRALCELGDLLSKNSNKSSAEILEEWKKQEFGYSSKTNYELLAEHRRTTGIYGLFASISKTSTQNFIDELEVSLNSSPKIK